MSKEATIIQTYNDEKRIYEYFVKGFDVSESIRVLLKAHKDAYDNERRVFAECKGYCEAEKEFKDRITDLEAKLAEKEKENIKDKIHLLEFLKANFADVYLNGVMKIDCYDRVKYSKDVDNIIDREISKLKGEW